MIQALRRQSLTSVFQSLPIFTCGPKMLHSFLRKFTLMDLYEYLIHSAEKELKRESMKGFKSQKAYKHFEDFIKKGTKVLPNDGTVTDRLQHWHVLPKRVITPQPLENIQFKKSQYGKTTCRSSRRSHSYNHEADMPAVQMCYWPVLHQVCHISGR